MSSFLRLPVHCEPTNILNEGLFAISTGDVSTSKSRKHTGGDNEVNDGCGDLREHLICGGAIIDVACNACAAPAMIVPHVFCCFH